MYIDSKVFLANVRVAGRPTFFPADDVKKHRCLVTVINNRGKNDQQVEMTDEFTLVFWGKRAQNAALYIDKGRALNVDGVLRSYTVDTGRVKPDGKKEFNRTTSIHVRKFSFGPDSKKELVKRIGGNLALIKAAVDGGTRDPHAPITAEELIVINRPAAYDYNPQLAAQTGSYGNAQVYIKGQGMLAAGSVPVQAGPAAGAPPITPAANLAKMEAEVAALKAAMGAQANGAAVNAPATANPF